MFLFVTVKQHSLAVSSLESESLSSATFSLDVRPSDLDLDLDLNTSHVVDWPDHKPSFWPESPVDGEAEADEGTDEKEDGEG